MTLSEEMDDSSALTASHHSARASTNRKVPVRVLEAILKDVTTAPSWSSTHTSRLTLATGEHAQHLREHYGRLFDEEIKTHVCKAEDPTVEILAPDGDYPMRKRYPGELCPAQIEVTKLLYGIYGIERGDIEERNRANRRNVVAFDAPVMGFVFVYEDMLPWSTMDAGLILQTLFLSTRSRGVNSCPVDILTTWREPVDAEFEIPEYYRFIAGFTLSYAGPEVPINTMKAPRPPIQLLNGKRCYGW